MGIAVGRALLPSKRRTLRTRTRRSMLHGSGVFMRAGIVAPIADRITWAAFAPLTTLSIVVTITGTTLSATRIIDTAVGGLVSFTACNPSYARHVSAYRKAEHY